MADLEKQLKFIFGATGQEKVQKAVTDLSAAFTNLTRSGKELQTLLASLDTTQKKSAETINNETAALEKQATAIERITKLKRVDAGIKLTDPNGMGSFFNPDANYRDYAKQMGGNRYFRDSRLIKDPPPDPEALSRGFSKAGGVLAAAGHMFGTATTQYGQWLQHSGQAQINEKINPLENLAGAQGYRNQVYMESQSGPVGWRNYRDSRYVGLKSKESGRVRTDENGNLIQPEGATAEFKGSDIMGRVQNMSGEQRVREGKWIGAAGGIGAGALSLLGGGAMMAGAVLGTGLTAGMGLPGTLAVGAAGLGVASGGVAQIVSAIWAVHSEEKKEREGKPEVEQSEMTQRAAKALDEVFAIQKYQSGVYNQMASTEVSINRSTLGDLAYVKGQTTWELGESSAITRAANRGYGRNIGGDRGKGAIFTAMDKGADMSSAIDIVGGFGSVGQDGGQMLKKLLTEAVKGGMETIDMPFFEKLAVASAKGMYGAGGARSGSAAGMMFSGINMANPNEYDLRGKQAGLALDKRLFQDTPWFSGRNTVMVNKLLGSDFSPERARALTTASIGDLQPGGSEHLQAVFMGVSEKRREEIFSGAIKARQAALGSIIGGNQQAKDTIGDRTFGDYLKDVAQTMKSGSKAERMLAKRMFGTVIAPFKDRLQEEWGGVKGLFELYGYDSKVSGSLDDATFPEKLKNLGGRGTVELSEKNKARNAATKAGAKIAEDKQSAEHAVSNPKFVEYLQKYDPKLLERWNTSRLPQNADPNNDGRPKDDPGLFHAVNAATRGFDELTAGPGGPGGEKYGSAGEISKQLGEFSKSMTTDVLGPMKTFVSGLQTILGLQEKYIRALPKVP
jgi:hypothetical protein